MNKTTNALNSFNVILYSLVYSPTNNKILYNINNG